MYKFFVDPSQIHNGKVTIEGSDLNHIKHVLRLKVGKEVMLSDGDGNDYMCCIGAYGEDNVSLDILEVLDGSTELPVYIHLYQGLPKKDKLELIVQKSVELGVGGLTPMSMKRSIVKIDDKSKAKKVIRWQGIADAASKQAKRGIQPTVFPPVTMKQIKDELSAYDLLLVPYENAKGMAYTREILSEVKNCDKIGIIIGPEGGFDPEEIDFLKSINAKVISLGKRILRTETAGLALLSYLMIDMEGA